MVSISANSDTPVYRQMIDDTLFNLLQMQAIDTKMFLENTNMPFADKILDAISKRQEEMASQAQAAGIDPNNPMQGVNPQLQQAVQPPQPQAKVMQ